MSRVLLHVCCGICAGHCVPALQERGDSVTLFYSNANIAPHAEFLRRLEAVNTVAAHFGVPVIVDAPDHAAWLESAARGFESAPERGARCVRCFGYSLARTEAKMREIGLDAFTTTLTVSPHKPSNTIFEIGKSLNSTQFLEIDFKKKDGFKHSNEVARQLELYRQNFCGCEFSRRRVPSKGGEVSNFARGSVFRANTRS